MTAFDCDVLVVGAGPTGLTMGCELMRHGVTCRVIDVLAEPVVYSKAAVVHARTMEIFESMGIAQTVIAKSNVLHGLSAFADGKRVAHVVLAELESPYPHVYGVSQHETEAILAARFLECGGRIERGVKLDSYTQDPDGVAATLLHADGRRETARARWLVGCDGAHSTVRHGLSTTFDGAPYEERIFQTDAHIQWPHRMETDEIFAFLSPQGPVACFPFFQDGRFRLLRLYTSEPPEGEPTLAHFQAMLDEVCPGATVSDPAWMCQFRLHHRIAGTFRGDRVFIVGDAAHIHSPTGGQGMNTGIQDAFNLAWKLAMVAQGAALPSLLETYESERRPIAQELLQGTDLATQAITTAIKFRNPVATTLRNGFVSLASRLDFVRFNATKTLSMLDRNYRKSPIVSQHRASMWQSNLAANDAEHPSVAAWLAFSNGPHPGDRAPDVVIHDAAGNDPARLYPLLGRRHTLLVFEGLGGTGNRADAEAINRHTFDRCGDSVWVRFVAAPNHIHASDTEDSSVIRDVHGALHERYGARASCLYLIRPDGHIAFRSEPADVSALLKYFDLVFTKRPIAAV